MPITGRIVVTAIAAVFGWCFGWVAGSVGHVIPKPANYPFLAELTPLPHSVPRYAGGIAFRFAMAQDVIHERFSKHGPDYYRERDRITRQKIGKLARDDPAGFALADDLAVGLDRLGRSSEAAAVMTEKLARQKARGLAGRDLYTTYANLGTFLIHGNFRTAAADPAARQRFRDGIALIRRAVEVNPEAHFGREQWQAAIAEFLLATFENPALLKTYDCLGNRLDLATEQILDREANSTDRGYSRPYDRAFSRGEVIESLPAFSAMKMPPETPSQWAEVSPVRGAYHQGRCRNRLGERRGSVAPRSCPL